MELKSSRSLSFANVQRVRIIHRVKDESGREKRAAKADTVILISRCFYIIYDSYSLRHFKARALVKVDFSTEDKCVWPRT